MLEVTRSSTTYFAVGKVATWIQDNIGVSSLFLGEWKLGASQWEEPCSNVGLVAHHHNRAESRNYNLHFAVLEVEMQKTDSLKYTGFFSFCIEYVHASWLVFKAATLAVFIIVVRFMVISYAHFRCNKNTLV